MMPDRTVEPAACSPTYWIALRLNGLIRCWNRETSGSSGSCPPARRRPPGEWYDQPWDEWILVIAGAAEILLDNEDTPRSLRPGDYLFLPALVRHRVTWTDPKRPTIWLAVHIGNSADDA